MTQQINLLDPTLLTQRDWCNGTFIVGLGALLALAIGGQWSYERWAMAQVLASSAAAGAEATAAATASIDAEIAELNTQLAGGEALLRTAGGLVELPRDSATRIESLISAMPQNLWLDEVEFSANRRVRITGGVSNAAGLAAFSKRLGESSAYSGLPLRVVALEPRESDGPEAADSAGQTRTTPLNTVTYHFVLASVEGDVAGAAK